MSHRLQTRQFHTIHILFSHNILIFGKHIPQLEHLFIRILQYIYNSIILQHFCRNIRSNTFRWLAHLYNPYILMNSHDMHFNMIILYSKYFIFLITLYSKITYQLIILFCLGLKPSD